jgi:hypothetical protein
MGPEAVSIAKSNNSSITLIFPVKNYLNNN